MRVTEVKYTRRFNIGNYEHEEIGTTAILEDGETLMESVAELKSTVAAAYAGADQDPKTNGAAKDDEEVEEETEEEDAGNDDEAEEETEEVEEEESKPLKKSSKSSSEAKASQKASSEKPGKKFVKKPQVYQRGNETQKEIFTGILRSVAPDWKKNDKSKAKGKEASIAMEGKPFLDENGEVLPAFRAAIKKLMGKK